MLEARVGYFGVCRLIFKHGQHDHPVAFESVLGLASWEERIYVWLCLHQVNRVELLLFFVLGTVIAGV